ncbi:DNA methyltransferase [Vibrio phage K406]
MSDKTALSNLYKALGNFLKPKEEVKELTKSVDIEERKCLEVMFEANKKDAHGNWYTEETIVKAKTSYDNNVIPANLFHMVETESFSVQDTFILEEDTTYENEGQEVFVQKGSMMAWTQYHDDELWEFKKSSELGGLSPAFLGDINKETGEITNVAFSLQDYRGLKEE